MIISPPAGFVVAGSFCGDVWSEDPKAGVDSMVFVPEESIQAGRNNTRAMNQQTERGRQDLNTLRDKREAGANNQGDEPGGKRS